MTPKEVTPEALAAEALHLLESLLAMQRGTGPNHGLTLPELFLLNRIQRIPLGRTVRGLDGREITQVVLLAGARFEEHNELRVYFFVPEDVVELTRRLLDHVGRNERRITPLAFYVSPVIHQAVAGERCTDTAALARLADLAGIPQKRGDRR
jgi:hypothetical protein